MHSVVQIDEIFLNILSWVAPAALLDLGLTCRAFYEPAMDARWVRLDNFVPLLKCLPSNAMADVYDKRTRHKFYITVRRLKPADWIRFEAHARRVKEYTIRASGLGTPLELGLSESITSAIAEHFGDRPVLPHLQTFENHLIGWRDDIRLLLHCPIHTVRLDYRRDPELYGEALTSELELVRRLDTVESLSMGSQLPVARQLSLLATMPNRVYQLE
ncbi:F-box protein [Phanerochaete sordida]|uniref:F-box protein n=1 Tax=Phanerochaete sordida TaxID=48140 RepID=A0A9P3LE20_9APHY|nr:F-box protein [Phanerochaete sordida]